MQKHGIPAILQGRDLISVAQTGSGKTGAFLIPTISQIVKHDLVSRMTPDYRRASPLMLIMTPTRELACQIFDECRKFAYRTGIRPCVVYGGVDARPQLDDLSRGCNILVATPGRLKDFIERGRISLEQVQFLVLDEADRM